MRKWRVSSDAGMMFGVRSEGRGCLQHFLETEILQDSLGDEQVQLGVESPAEVELHQHVATTLPVSALQEMFPRLCVLLQLPQTVGEVLAILGVLAFCWTFLRWFVATWCRRG